ncbi:MAG: aldehyde dehydrogenase family protein [Eubacteriales bacterium]|nr:aldehyde dehydrogenase family protein [Eubacteriales bacterium]
MGNYVKESYKMFIGGKWKNAADNATLTALNPATGEKLASFPDATKEDVDAAVAAARAAFRDFKWTSVGERADILDKIAKRIEDHAELLANVESLDNGKPIRETRAVDVKYAYEHFKYFAGCIRADEGKASILEGNKLSMILHEPIGVVGQIIPWNFPFLMAAWKLAPAIAAGDCVVIKPSSLTSLSLLTLMELIEDILPAGVVNVVTGKGSKSGEYLKNHEGLDKLAFTGSTEIGREIAVAAARRLIPATLELGGKSANIIFDDADMKQAVDGVQLGILFNQGQVCCAGSRVFVQEGIYDEFVKKLVDVFRTVKVGNPLDEGTMMGCQIDGRQVEKILSYVAIAEEEGARIITGGKRHTDDGCEKGAFMQPTLIADVTNDMRVAQEEIFGPVAVIIKFKDEDDVIKMANDSCYGLGGAVFTQDIQRALYVARGLETGRVWINCYNQIPEGSPFGGYKQSGIGRETHKVILEHYTQMKNIMIDLTGEPSGFYNV